MKGKFVIALLPAVLFSISSCQHKVGKVSMKTEHDSVSYIIGHNIGTNLGASPMTEVNIAAIAKGMQDALDEKELFMELTAANMYVSQYMQKLEESVKNWTFEDKKSLQKTITFDITAGGSIDAIETKYKLTDEQRKNLTEVKK